MIMDLGHKCLVFSGGMEHANSAWQGYLVVACRALFDRCTESRVT
jgi:hypothetical protein